MEGELMQIDGELNFNAPEPNLVKHPLISLYKERMGESVYGKLMGIMIPAYALTMFITLFWPKNLLSLTIASIVSLGYIISYLLLVNYKNNKKNIKKQQDKIKSF